MDLGCAACAHDSSSLLLQFLQFGSELHDQQGRLVIELAGDLDLHGDVMVASEAAGVEHALAAQTKLAPR